METRGPQSSLPSYQWRSFRSEEKNFTRPRLSPVTTRLPEERERKREAGINTVCKEVKSMARVQVSAVSHKPLSSNIHKN